MNTPYHISEQHLISEQTRGRQDAQTLEDIRRSALESGACALIRNAASVRQAVSMLLTPQGREFALKTGFPSLALWRRHKENLGMEDVLIDCGQAIAEDCDFIAVGDSRIMASFSGPARLHHVVAMHGAEVEIHASNYAVVTVTAVNASVIVHDDPTAIVTVEEGGESWAR